MTDHDTFSSYHPLVNFLYFAVALLFAMFIMHPVCMAISLASSLCYLTCQSSTREVRRRLLFLLPMILLAGVMNPLFNHQGTTVLWYFKSGNPLTLESIWYGLFAGAMLAAVMCWFICYERVMTSDKFIYLFGRIVPALSLIISMTLRFIPRFKVQLQTVRQAQASLGRREQTRLDKLKNALRVFSVMVTWALENSIETADSMRARGYGLPGRTAFSIYRWSRRDTMALLFILAASLYVLLGVKLGLPWTYFPAAKGVLWGTYPCSIYLVYFALLMMPMALNIREDRLWLRLQSKN